MIYQFSPYNSAYILNWKFKPKDLTIISKRPHMISLESELVKAAIRGFSRVVILWLLSQKILSGYSVTKELKKLTGWNFHSGIVYPLLYELEESRLITGKWVRRGRRRIKYYCATRKGLIILNRIRELLKMPVKEVLKDFMSQA